MIQLCIYTVYTYIYIITYLYIYIYMYIYIYVYIYMYIYKYICIYIYHYSHSSLPATGHRPPAIRIYIYIYIYTHIQHTHTQHTHTQHIHTNTSTYKFWRSSEVRNPLKHEGSLVLRAVLPDDVQAIRRSAWIQLPATCFANLACRWKQARRRQIASQDHQSRRSEDMGRHITTIHYLLSQTSIDLTWFQCGRVLASSDSWRRIIKHTVEWLSAFLWWWRLRRSNYLFLYRAIDTDFRALIDSTWLDLQVKGIVWSHWSDRSKRLRLTQQQS